MLSAQLYVYFEHRDIHIFQYVETVNAPDQAGAWWCR